MQLTCSQENKGMRGMPQASGVVIVAYLIKLRVSPGLCLEDVSGYQGYQVVAQFGHVVIATGALEGLVRVTVLYLNASCFINRFLHFQDPYHKSTINVRIKECRGEPKPLLYSNTNDTSRPKGQKMKKTRGMREGYAGQQLYVQ